MKQSQVSRVELIRIMAAMPDAPKEVIADLCGMEVKRGAQASDRAKAELSAETREEWLAKDREELAAKMRATAERGKQAWLESQTAALPPITPADGNGGAERKA